MQTAKQVLDRYWNGILPVLPEAIAQAENIELRPVAAVGRSGMYDFNGGQPFIEYNPHEPVVRKRFTVAHELGHHFNGDTLAPRLDSPDTFSMYQYDPIEVGANRFAAELLMPENYVRYLVLKDGINDIDELADLFRVSGMAMMYRLKNMGLL